MNKNLIKKIFYVLLLSLLMYLSMVFVIVGFNLLAVDFGCAPFLDYEINFVGCGTFGILLFYLSYLFNSICLYIYSYKIYTKKDTWYKFFREREKEQHKQNVIDYKNYIKGKE